MPLSLTVFVALRSLLSNKLRSLLTISGIVVGVAALIATWSISQGAKLAVQQKLDVFGKDSIHIYGGSRKKGGANGVSQYVELTVSDWDAIRNLDSIRAACPIIWGEAQLVYGSSNWHSNYQGTTNDYFAVRRWDLQMGRYFTDEEVRNGATVCILGSKVAQKLFGGSYPVGRDIRIQQFTFSVIGVLTERGSLGGRASEDDNFLVPYTTVQRKLKRYPNIHMILAAAKDTDKLKPVAEHIKLVLRQKNSMPSDADEAYESFTAEQAFKTYREGTNTFSWLTLLTAGVCLFVGGMGITNTMLMAVNERTREIGVRLALGARPQDILLQFLIEAMTLSALGGLLGVALGTLVSLKAADATSWEPVLSIRAILLSFGCSATTGLVSGTYPAWVASRLDPVEALRND